MDELERIRLAIEALGEAPTWNWTQFLSTLVATLVGAGITGMVAFFVLRTQRRDQYRGTVREAARTCLEAILRYNRARFGGATMEEARVDGTEAEAELSMLRAIVKKKDRRAVHAMCELAHEAIRSKNGYAAGYAFGWLNAFLADLVRGELSPTELEKRVEQQRTKLKLANKASPPSEVAATS